MKRFFILGLLASLALLGALSFSATSKEPGAEPAGARPEVGLEVKTNREIKKKPVRVPVRIIRILRQHGFSLPAAAGVAGNALQESGWDPASRGMGGGGLWGFTTSPVSLLDMQSWAAERDMRWDTVRAQTLFVAEHIAIHDANFLSRLNNLGSLKEAAVLFCWEWERPYAPTANIERRVWGARRALELFQNEL